MERLIPGVYRTSEFPADVRTDAEAIAYLLSFFKQPQVEDDGTPQEVRVLITYQELLCVSIGRKDEWAGTCTTRRRMGPGTG